MPLARHSAAALPPLRHNRARGILMRLTAITSFSVMAAIIKLAYGRGVSTPEIMFYRSSFAMPVLLAWLAGQRQWRAWRTSRPGAHVVRGAIGLVSMAMAFSALALLPLAEGTTISFAAPLFALALSAPVLGERVGTKRWIAVLVGFAGVLIVMQPGGSRVPLLGTAVALGAAFGVACVTVTVRSISRTESTLTIVLWFTALSIVATGLLLPWFGAPHDPFTWLLLAAIGVTGGVGQIGLTASLRHAPVATLAPIDYLQLLYAVLFGWFLFGARPALTTGIGAGLIILGVLSTVGRRAVRDTPASAQEI